MSADRRPDRVMTEQELTALEEWANYTQTRSNISRGTLMLLEAFKTITARLTEVEAERDQLKAKNDILNGAIGEMNPQDASDAISRAVSTPREPVAACQCEIYQTCAICHKSSHPLQVPS